MAKEPSCRGTGVEVPQPKRVIPGTTQSKLTVAGDNNVLDVVRVAPQAPEWVSVRLLRARSEKRAGGERDKTQTREKSARRGLSEEKETEKSRASGGSKSGKPPHPQTQTSSRWKLELTSSLVSFHRMTVLSLEAESKMSLFGWLMGVAIAVTQPSWPSRVPRKVKVSAMVRCGV